MWGEGHYHIFLDVLPTPPGSPIPKGPGIFHVSTPTFVIHGVASGQHHLYAELGFSDHIPYQNTAQLLAFTGGVGAPQKIAAAPTPTPVASAPATSPTSSAQGPVAATVQLLADPTNGGKYNPASVSIRAGQAVKWTWVDSSASHSVTADDNSFDSTVEGQGSTYNYTFSKAGSYPYHCSVHPLMKGTITVS
jgi:plastocyanin